MSRLRHPIRSIREPFGKAGLIVAILALVMAMVGGAWAAGGLNGKQKKEVKAIAKSFQGTGPAGAPGTPGSNGTNGKEGAPGAPGQDGADGKSVVVGSFTAEDEQNEEPAGEPCELQGGNEIEVESSGEVHYACNGEEGSPWTVGGVLPIGETLKGEWAANGSGFVSAPISFNIPLSGPLDSSHVHYLCNANNKEPPAKEECEEDNEPLEQVCPGSVANPLAAAGHLCVYEFFTFHVAPEIVSGVGEGGATAFGALVNGGFVFPESFGDMNGSWAVTAG